MLLSELTSREAVLDAIREFDQLGRERFLEKHRFGPARSFFLEHEGKRYDSKAIVGAAYGYQFPERGALASNEFSGGEATVRAVLERLGFSVSNSSQTPQQPVGPEIDELLEQLPIRRKEPFGGHDDLKALMTRIRTGLEQLPAVASRQHVRVSWSLGAGNWARVPWIALMDQRETNSTQRGIYCVFLFPEDMSGVYLTLNQGVTEVIQREGRAQGRRSLSQRGAGLRASLDFLRQAEFRLDDDIDLRTEGDLGLDYESSTIAYKFYPKGHAPDDDSLNADLEALLQGYEISLAHNTQELPGAKQSWIFQGNPKLFDIDGAVKNLSELTWTVPEKGKRPTIGDSVFLWRAGRDAGIIATATVISEASQIEDDPEELPYLIDRDRFAGLKLRVRIRIDQRLPTTLLRSTIAAEPRLSDLMILRFANYSTFSVPQNHAEALQELLTESLQQGAVASHPDQRVWLYAPGEGADHWDEFYESGLMGIGWDELGDLSRFGSIDDLMTTMQEVYGDSTRPLNNAKTCFDFVSTLRPGDLVFAKRGRTTIVGHGVVVGEFEYHPERADLRNVRAVHWQSRGEWSTATPLPIKTLTDLTNAPDLVEALKQLVSISKIEVRKPADERVLEPFTVDQAMDGIFMPRSELVNALEVWRSKKNLILQGPPGVGKSFVAKRMAYALMGHRDPSRLRTVQFHQSYSYEDFVQGYRPSSNGFILKPGVFLEFCERALADPETKYVFVIDEINRGNLSKILGELMLLIEPDKRGPDWATKLAYAESAEARFYVPDNVYILGMMNTADRSLSLVDYALRRRFAFLTLRPQFGAPAFRAQLRSKGAPEALITRLVTSMTALNEAISDNNSDLGPGFCIGHSFFASIPDGTVADEAWYARVVQTEIAPLLEEYWADNPNRVEEWVDRLTD